MDKLRESTSFKQPLVETYGFRFLILQLTCLAAAFFLGRMKLFESLPPFAVALASVMPAKYLLVAVAGGIFGCATESGAFSTTVIGGAAIIAAALINRAASTVTAFRENSLVAMITAFLCCAATGITVQLADVFTVNSAVIFLCDSVLAGSAAYFFSRSRSVFISADSSLHISTAEASCIILCACAMLMSLSTVSVFMIVPARAAGALVILISSYIFKETGGSVSGICVGAPLELTTKVTGLAGIMSLGGLVCGIFANKGRFFSVAALGISAGLYTAVVNTPESVAVFAEVAAACLIFMIIPQRYLEYIKNTALMTCPVSAENSPSDASVLRIKSASEAFECVSRRVAEVNELSNPEESYGKQYACEQFDFVSEILSDISEELRGAGSYSHDKSLRTAEIMRSFGIKVAHVTCFYDAMNRLMITAVADSFDRDINKKRLSAEIGKACGCVLCIPSVKKTEAGFIISFSQQAKYKTRIGAVQRACGENEFCGDFFEMFCDGHGRQIIVLSDGMGTGGRAAIDASMTAGLFSELVRSGLSFDCSLKTVNSALMSRGIDESLSTLDVACIDLYSGRTEFMKAGGAATFVRRKGRAARLELASLPAGILREVGFERAYSELSSGDVILMISDGISIGNDDWILDALRDFDGGSAQELAEQIADTAALRRGSLHEDDTTVLVIIPE